MLRSWPRPAGNGLDVARGLGPAAGDDGAGEPAEHYGVADGHPGRDGHVDPGLLVDVHIYDGLAAHGGDGRGDITEGNGLRPSESIASARVRGGVEKGLDRDRRDIRRVDECLATPAARDGERFPNGRASGDEDTALSATDGEHFGHALSTRGYAERRIFAGRLAPQHCTCAQMSQF